MEILPPRKKNSVAFQATFEKFDKKIALDFQEVDGDFQNPPEVVSSIFARLIRKYDFEIVEFAVFCRGDTKNFNVFQKRLAEIKN